MDHMRILGTEPSLVILSQNKVFKKMKSDAQKVPKQAKAIRDGVINPQNYNCNRNSNSENFDALKTLTNQPKSIVELGFMCPRGLSGPPAKTLAK